MIDLLEGVRVLDFTHVHAGPLCTYQLALMGATVIKVESPNGGDQMRQMGAQFAPGMSPGFIGQNANKTSIALDLKHEKSQPVIRRLLEDSDVLVINMRPGTSNRLGIDYETVKSINPDLVYCAISGYGQEGPESDRPAMDHLMQGESGMILATGSEEQPARVGFAVSDASTALISSSAINAALLRRANGGSGAYLDVSMLESSMAIMGLHYYNYFATDRINPRPGANPLASMGSAGTWQCAEGTLLVNANNMRLFTRMAGALGQKELASDERFNSLAKLTMNCQELRAIFGSIFKTNTANHWDGLLREAGVPSGILKGLPETVKHAQLAYRNSLGSIDDVPGMNKTLKFLGAGFLVDGAPTTPSSPPPLLGQQTREILKNLGFSHDEIADLVKNQVVKCPDVG